MAKGIERRHAEHLAQQVTAGIMKSIRAEIPNEFTVEVARTDPNRIVLYKQTVIDFCGEGITWDGMMAQFQVTAIVRKKEFPEVRVKPYGEFILLVGVTLIGDKE